MNTRKLKSKLQSFVYRKFGNPKAELDVNKGLFGWLVAAREFEALLSGPQDMLICGDSIMHAGEGYFESNISHCMDTAISGQTTKTLLGCFRRIILPYRPKRLFLHVSGNDTLQNQKLNDTLMNLLTVIHVCRSEGVKEIYWAEILPLGKPRFENKEFSKLNNEIIPEYNQMVKNSKCVDVISTRSTEALSGPDGWIKPEYNSGDNIHNSPLAYERFWLPTIKTVFGI